MAIILLLCACAHTPNIFQIQGPRVRLFPPGTYFHEVTISMADGRKQKVQGIVKSTTSTNRIVGLGPFQITLFKLEENLSAHQTKLEIFEPKMEKLRDKILSFYQALSPLLNYRLKNAEERPTNMKVAGYMVEITDYDENALPREITLQNDKLKVNVKVTQYEVVNEPN